jgi:hypothetical protein
LDLNKGHNLKKLIVFGITTILIFKSLYAKEIEKNDNAEKPKIKKEKVKKSFGYITTGTGPFPFVVPTFGLGYRYQKNHIGMDISLDASTIYFLTSIKITPSTLFYLSPNKREQLYFGIGPNLGVLIPKNNKWLGTCFYFSPALILGRNYQKKGKKNRIYETRIEWPTFFKGKLKKKKLFKNKKLYCPLVYFKYGMGF